jgi:hypothetical protein
MKKKPYIIIKDSEKELYRIFKDLERYGRTTFNYPDRKKQQSIARKIGVRGQPLINDDLLFPPARTRNSKINIVALPPKVEIKEEKLRKISRFNFLRKK